MPKSTDNDEWLRKWVGARLKRLSQERGYSAARVAEAIGVGESTIRKWHNGFAQPSFGHLQAYVSLFGMTLGEFFEGDTPCLPEEVVALLTRLDAKGIAFITEFLRSWDRYEASPPAESRADPPAESRQRPRRRRSG